MGHDAERELELVGNYFIKIFTGTGALIKALSLGLKELPKKKNRYYVLAASIIIATAIFCCKTQITELIPERLRSIGILAYASPLLPVIYLYWLGEDRIKYINSFKEKFEMIGFYAKGKRRQIGLDGRVVEKVEYPKYLGEISEGKKIILSFLSNIPIGEWKAKATELETIFDCNIIKIENSKTSKQVVKLHTIPSDQGLKDYIPWSDEYIKEKDFEICVGVAMLEDVVFDLNKVPHALIAGVTGSGKSVIERCILWQCVKKGAKIYMIDFKGGVEFSKRYEEYGEVVTDRQRVIEILQELIRENEARLRLFRELDVKNLAEYNSLPSNLKPKGRETLCRIILIADEVAEMLDKTGLSKEEKQIYSEIEGYLGTLARLARATGINMIMATQRPDARVLPGQIKNNLPIRISGRMIDPQASEMVLGSSKAAELSDTRGRFMYAVGADIVEFQAFMFEDKYLKRGHFQIGSMLSFDGEEETEEAAASTVSSDTLKKDKPVYEIKGNDVSETVEPDKPDNLPMLDREKTMFKVDEKKVSGRHQQGVSKENGPAKITTEDLAKYFKIN
ncbi:MAG: FtsK/SpoIIIE domain-containing protein [Caulobacteraceae bacterium]